MKKMKKMIAILLCMAMVISMAACGNRGSGSKSAEENTATDVNSEKGEEAGGETAADNSGVPEDGSEEGSGTEAANGGKPVYIDEDAASMTGEVRFLTAFAGGQGTDTLIEDFNSYYPNVNVTYEVYVNNAEGNVTANTSIQSGAVDVILSFGPADTGFRWENGLLMDITDRLAEDRLDLVTEWGTDNYTYNGRVYCIPAGALSVVVALNMDMWNEAGLGEIPDYWTWDEYLDACRAMTRKAADGSIEVYGGTQFNNTPYWYYPMMQSKGKDVFYNEEGMADFTSGLAEKIVKRQLDAEEEGIWYKQINLITDNQKSRDLLWSGQVASCIESLLTRFVTDTENYPHDFILGYAPYPVNEDGETNYMHGAMTNSFFCVTNNAKDADAAYAFAKFASTYGSKYLYKAGHASGWSGTNPDEIVDLVFGSREEAEKFVDVDSYIANSLAVGKPFYADENITGYSQIASLCDEYFVYMLNGSMTVEDALAELNEYADEAIEDAQ